MQWENEEARVDAFFEALQRLTVDFGVSVGNVHPFFPSYIPYQVITYEEAMKVRYTRGNAREMYGLKHADIIRKGDVIDVQVTAINNFALLESEKETDDAKESKAGRHRGVSSKGKAARKPEKGSGAGPRK